MKYFIPHNKLFLDEQEELAGLRVLKSCWLAQGNETEYFENELCDFIGIPVGHCCTFSSGSAALFVALKVCGVKDSLVAMPVFSCVAALQSVLLANGLPNFVDSIKIVHF